MLTFFGRRPEDRPLVHGEIFNLIYQSNGSFSFSELYEMPNFLRLFYHRKLIDALKADEERMNSKINKGKKGK